MAVHIDFCEEFGSRNQDLTRFAQIIHKNIVSRIIKIDRISKVADFDRFRVHIDSFGIDFPDNAIVRVLAGHSHVERMGII
jgi:hypothetical protein